MCILSEMLEDTLILFLGGGISGKVILVHYQTAYRSITSDK